MADFNLCRDVIFSDSRNGLEIQETGWKVGEVERGQTLGIVTRGLDFITWTVGKH